MQITSAPATDGANQGASADEGGKILHPEFAYRLGVACDSNSHCPPLNHGRLGWIAEQVKGRAGKTVSNESVRRWLAGEALPRPATLAHLANILKVEEAWLSVGASPESSRERKATKIVENGAVTVLAGLIQMSGGSPAFPSENDSRAKQERIDLYAIIRGAQYAFNVSAGVTKGDTVQFNVAVDATNCVMIGAVLRENLTVEFYEIPRELAVSAPLKSGAHNLTLTGDLSAAGLKRIKSFSERI